MPIYMDRHRVKGVTQEAIASAHQQDLRIQGRYGVRFLTYWLDEAQSSTFCLVDAPNPEIIGEVHAAAHGKIPNRVIEVDPAAVEAFLGRVEDPAPGDRGQAAVDSGFRAVMFTDLVDFTSTTVQVGDVAAMELLREHNRMIRDALSGHGGTEVKHTGDGIMASFRSAIQAVDCSGEIQRAFEARNASARIPMTVRVGISWGAPVEDRGDLFGAAVQLAARLCTLAGPAQILIAREIQEAAGQRFRQSSARSVSVRGFSQPLTAFEVGWRASAS